MLLLYSEGLEFYFLVVNKEEKCNISYNTAPTWTSSHFIRISVVLIDSPFYYPESHTLFSLLDLPLNKCHISLSGCNYHHPLSIFTSQSPVSLHIPPENAISSEKPPQIAFQSLLFISIAPFPHLLHLEIVVPNHFLTEFKHEYMSLTPGMSQRYMSPSAQEMLGERGIFLHIFAPLLNSIRCLITFVHYKCSGCFL